MCIYTLTPRTNTLMLRVVRVMQLISVLFGAKLICHFSPSHIHIHRENFLSLLSLYIFQHVFSENITKCNSTVLKKFNIKPELLQMYWCHIDMVL